MPEAAYVAIAGDFGRRIRSGELPPHTQLPSNAAIQHKNITGEKVSEIVVRNAIGLLLSQGLVYSIRRRGIFVAERPSLVRVSPERQLEKAESTFTNESDKDVHVERESSVAIADAVIAQALKVDEGTEVSHVVTRITEDGAPVSISDTFQPKGYTGISGATALEERVSDEVPDVNHADWLNITAGDLVKQVEQRFLTKDDKPVMVSKVSYPRDRYGAMVFRMTLDSDD